MAARRAATKVLAPPRVTVASTAPRGLRVVAVLAEGLSLAEVLLLAEVPAAAGLEVAELRQAATAEEGATALAEVR